jgi:hypothetical protein
LKTSLSKIARTVHFRVGVYKPGEEDKVKFCGPKFEPTRLDAAAMYSAIKRYGAKSRRLRIGVFIVEGGRCEAKA